MRTKLLLAGLAAGAAAALLPAAPASAQCGWTLEGAQHCGSCTAAIEAVDDATADLREQHGVGPLAQHFVCTQ